MVDSGHRLDTSKREIVAALKMLPGQIAKAQDMRATFALALPRMVARYREFKDDCLVRVVNGFLVRANYRSHSELFKALNGRKGTATDIDTPEG